MRANDAITAAYPHMILDPAAADYDELLESARAVSRALAPALSKDGADRSRGLVGIVGHSHLDTAWLWPVSETIRKAARTYSEVLGFMEVHPDYRFIQSSALHLDWMREYYPSIFQRIAESVREGSYEPNGGEWVEFDCNITGGESMIRQFLYGQRFTREHFGYTSDCFWLPDTFGYNAAIPQIMLGCDVRYFYTTKMSWNDLNGFPHDSFVWRGIDGSEVLTHLNTVNVIPNAEELTGAIAYIKNKDASDMRLLAYGYGDGGGGPSYGMFEYIDRMRDVPGMPEVKEMSVSEFMHRLEERRDRLPVYDGELYLEFHRGTLTQMHDIKKNNRLAESALRDMEYMNVLAGSERHPRTDELYKLMLKNQFHDILPGTCIECVNDLARQEMTGLISDVRGVVASYADSMTDGDCDAVTLFNTLSFDRHDTAVFDGSCGFTDAPSQTYRLPDGSEHTAVSVDIPAFGTAVLHRGTRDAMPSPFSFDGERLETPYYSAVIDGDGYISSLTDLRRRREIAGTSEHPLGRLMFGEDVSTQYDNWELEYDVFMKLSKVRASAPPCVVSDGEVEFRLRTEYPIGRHSKAVVDTVFYAADPRIDFEMTVDWNERHSVLKASFDTAIRATRCANEIQFGYVERPTTENDSAELAKFEVCNHKYTDISETRYGVAVLNDCKYGISVRGSEMMLTLHRGGCRPDTTNDRGVHSMVYSLLPHEGALSAEAVVHPAYELNHPPVVSDGVLNCAADSPVAISEPNIICVSVKTAEDERGAYVLRLYECERNRTLCRLDFGAGARVWRTNMLEEIECELQLDSGAAEVEFSPFEIVTLLVKREN